MRRQRRGEKPPDARADDRRPRCHAGASGDRARGGGDLAEQAAGDAPGEIVPDRVGCRGGVAPDHPRQPRAALRWRLAAPVGRRLLVGIGRKLAGETEDVGGRREELGHDADARSGEHEMRGKRHHRRAHDAAIDELVQRQPPGIVAAAGRHHAAAQGHEIGRGAADIDQQPVADLPRRELRRGVPIGRGDALGRGTRRGGREKTAIIGVDLDAAFRHALGQRVEDRPHAGGAVGKKIGELGGHRHRMALRLRPGGQRVVQRRGEPIEAEPERARHLAGRDDLAALDPRQLEMGAADIPAENAAHDASTETATGRGASGRTSRASGPRRSASTSSAGLRPMLSARPI